MITENGWPACDSSGTEWVHPPGTTVSLQLQKGLPCTILRAFAGDFNAYIEPLRDPDSAGWTATNSVATSNHLGGTAMDLNWNSHPFQVADAGFNRAQIATIRELLDFYEGTVFWANDWDSPKDAMHWQMGYGTFDDQDHLRDFIARKIRSDGFSTFRRDSSAGSDEPDGMTAETLSAAMGGSLSMNRYRELLPAFTAALRQAECTTVNRVAMWCAQVGHESSGLRYMEEIADGSAYEGRSDLGNTQPGDGRRFKGHGPIQITGRHNHTEVSKWAHSKGLVPSPTYFVDHPEALGSDEYGFLGVVWYWTIARPKLNSLADAGDVVAATRAVNGGTNGLDDRIRRWNNCRALGEALLPGTGEDDELMGIRFINEDGNEVDAATALKYIDKRSIQNERMLMFAIDQLCGPGVGEAVRDGRLEQLPPGWKQAGGRYAIDLLAAVAKAEGVSGAADTKASK